MKAQSRSGSLDAATGFLHYRSSWRLGALPKEHSYVPSEAASGTQNVAPQGAVRVGWLWSWSAHSRATSRSWFASPRPRQPGQVVTLAGDLHRPQLRCHRPKIQSPAAWSELQAPSLPEGVVLERGGPFWAGSSLPCSGTGGPRPRGSLTG